MRDKLVRRMDELRSEYQTGRAMEAELESKRENLRSSLLRISGAIMILEEILGSEPEMNGAGRPDDEAPALAASSALP